jgi:cystathionine beta-lyase/cystathionine gamma-synthase
MSDSAEDLCPRPDRLPPQTTEPMAPPIFPASVYRCKDILQASQLLAGDAPGYVYSRDGHPNADLLSEKCAALHGAEMAAVCSSGMAALALALVALVKSGEHLVVSRDLYGRTLELLTVETARLGINSTVVDTGDLAEVSTAMRPETALVVVETISNPLLRVSDIGALAELVHEHDALLLVDNSFASPVLCQPIRWGADLVMESLTKIINGHSDVLLGLLATRRDLWPRIAAAHSIWGFSASPFDCWLVSRGLGTLALRAEAACRNAAALADFLSNSECVKAVHYPASTSHPEHSLAQRQFGARGGWMVTFTLEGSRAAAEKFIASAEGIAFSPSLGELSTTLSHPASTSHRAMTEPQRQALGIDGGTIRMSVGIESTQSILDAVQRGLSGIG